MKKLSIFILFAITSFSFITKDWWPTLLQKLEQYNQYQAYEKVYLHTDQTYYQPGDIIWFSAYLLDQKNEPSKISSVLYVDIILPDGKVAKTLELNVAEGKTAGTVKLAEESTGGIYHLKAYTQWMKNFDEKYFFSKEITVYQYVPPQLLLKIDFDKENYAPGSQVKIDFSARNLDNLPIANQKFTYKISIDGKQVLEKEVLTNHEGEAQLEYMLSSDLKSIDALVNVVIKDQGISEAISRSIPIVLEQIDLKFFPEGGNLIADTKNRVAFKASTEYGQPANIIGAVYDQDNKLITEVNSFHMGMGSFVIQLEKDKSYHLKILEPKIEEVFHLPQKYTAYGMSADYQENKGAVLLSYFAPDPEKLTVVAIAAGKDQYEETFSAQKGWNEIEIPVANWPIGITRFTLFDAIGNPQAERLLFLNKNKQLKVNIATDQESYFRREKVNLKITTTDASGQPVPANLSLAVANDQLISLADDKQANILASLLLDSELQGEITEPSFYFDSTETKADAALDLVMLTHGWRRFSWQEITNEDYLIEYLPEAYSTISGTVHHALKLKPMKGIIYLVETSGKQRVAKTKTGKDGRFAFANVNTEGPLQLYCKTPLFQSNNVYIDLDGNYGTTGAANTNSIIMQPDIQMLYDFEFNNFGNEPRNRNPQPPNDVIGGERQLNSDAPISMSLTEDVQQLSEVVVVGYGEENYSSVTIQEINSTQIFGNNLQNALQGKIAGVQVVESENLSENRVQIRGINSIASNDPVLVVNGIVMETLDLQQLQPDNVKSISIIKGAEAVNLYGAQAAQGVVIVTTDQEIVRNQMGRLPKSKYTFLLLNGRMYHKARQFPQPDYDQQPISSKKDDFRNTIYWNPEIITDENGQAEVSFFNSDASTTFRITVEGIGTGLIGRAEKTYAVNDALDVQVKTPPYLTTSDSLLVAVNVKSNMHNNYSGTLGYAFNPYFSESYRKHQSIQLASEEFTTQYLTLMPVKPGETALQFNLEGMITQQNVELPVKILPIGFPVEQSWSSDQLKKTFTVNINDPVVESINFSFIAYPNLMSDLFDGVESIIRAPHGCFEQVSASTYPNIMALQYMRKNSIVDPEIEKKAISFIAQGYEKLIAYETSDGGYEWFGNTPPHEGLTAFGLLEFAAMKKVWKGIDENIIDKTAQWLLARKDGKGGFKQSSGKYAFARANEEVVNTYIVYALSEAGYFEIEDEFQTALTSLNEKDDNYRKALLALTAFNLAKKEDAEKMLDQIKRSIKKHSIDELPALHSITYSMGKPLQVETAALCAMAFMQSAQPDITLIKQIIDYIISQRSFGGFGSTQATILGLQALVDYAKLAKKSMDAGDIVVFINGKKSQQKEYGNGQTGTIEMNNLQEYLNAGNNEVQVKINSVKSEPLPYSLNLSYNSFTPQSSPACLIDLTTTLSMEKTKLQETVRLTAQLKNKRKQPLPMTMALIGIPAGLSLQPWQLKEMQEKRLFDYYEITENYLVIYFSSLPNGEQKLNFDLKADFAGQFQAPASVAYLYYSKEEKDWERGEVIEVAVE